MTIGRFLNGIAALIWDPETERYLLLRRSAAKDFASGDWECVTGRVDQGESYTQALLREVREEIGLQAHIEFLIAVTHFYRGEALPENELLGVIFGCTVDQPHLAQSGEEHSQMRWATIEEAHALLPPGHWLHRVIARAELYRRLAPEEMRREIRENGLDL